MRFSKKRAGKQEDLERLILSHQKVCDFLRDSSNAFDASLCDWMYESDEDIYDYIKGQIPPGYSPGVEEVNPEDDVQIVKWTQKENEAVYEWTRNKDIEKPPHQRALHSVHSSPSCIVPTVPVRKQPPSEDPGFGTSPHPSRRDRIQDWEWYRDELTDEKAKRELEHKPPGTFLVRKTAPKTAEPDGSLHVFTLEFVIEHSRTKKLMIMKTGDVYHFKEFRQQGQETQTFKTVSDLVAKVLAIGLEIKDPRTNLWTTFQVKPVWLRQ
ncbi:uncharacterized protein LOC127871144 [Dreissena polymorpha]|uniref:uncharacterized protein LOC127871144 n=1 Tax=Dreissena polymorpha TaxID=45954 RepID=UPI002265067F|nr:uncharacterized protein LOC127871144 [Dreissena polymorpha]